MYMYMYSTVSFMSSVNVSITCLELLIIIAFRYWQTQFSEDFRFVPELGFKLSDLQSLIKENGDDKLLDYLEMDQL